MIEMIGAVKGRQTTRAAASKPVSSTTAFRQE